MGEKAKWSQTMGHQDADAPPHPLLILVSNPPSNLHPAIPNYLCCIFNYQPLSSKFNQLERLKGLNQSGSSEDDKPE